MIYTFGDGFAAGHIWPEWPQFIEILTQSPVSNFGHIGAGNEFIFNCAVKAALTATSDDIFLIQWADPNRFDKIIEDKVWKELQKTDIVYADINSTVFDQTWWSTSASQLSEIEKYKSFYIQEQQAYNRTFLYMISLSKMLDFLKIKHLYFSTYPIVQAEGLPWIDIDLESYSQQFNDRESEIQPSPIVHFRYVVEKILPRLNINLKYQTEIEQLIKNYNFVAFDSDRKYIWEKFKDEISLFFK